MDELNDREWRMEDEALASVEGALRSLPLAEPPPGLFTAVMAQVDPTPAIELPVFRLNWMDFALSLFFAGMIGLAMLLSGWLPVEFRMTFAYQMRWMQMLHLDWVLWAALGAGAAASVAAGLVFANSLSSLKNS